MKTKKYHFGKRWAIRNEHGQFQTMSTYFTNDIINAKVYRKKIEAIDSAGSFPEWVGAEVVCVKETVYVVEL